MSKIGKNKIAGEFEKLYFETYTQLCQSTFRFIKDQDITKDIVQEAFLKYWQKINELHIHESPRAYLHRACINGALNYLKEKERREIRESTFAEGSSESSSKSAQPDVKYLHAETSANLQNAIDQLPTACKNVFLLSRYEQKSYKEIAALLNISVNTVEKHIGKALMILRKQIKEL